MFRSYLFNGYRRFAAEALYVLIPFGTGMWQVAVDSRDSLTAALGYAIYSWANRYDAWQNSKAGHLALAHKEEAEH